MTTKETVSTGKELYGLPHLGATYIPGWSNHKRNYRRTTDVCVVCDTNRSNQIHHVDLIGIGGNQHSELIVVDVDFCENYDNMPLLLKTKNGKHTLYTPLFALCGWGNASGCHGDFHDPRNKVEWIWTDKLAKELWHKGWFLAHGYTPHDPRLFEYGYYRITISNKVTEVCRAVQ